MLIKYNSGFVMIFSYIMGMTYFGLINLPIALSCSPPSSADPLPFSASTLVLSLLNFILDFFFVLVNKLN